MKNIYRIIKTGLILSVAALSFAACSEDFMDEINKDHSVSTNVTAKFIIPDLELRTAQNIVGGDFNTYFGSYVEYWAGTHNQLFKAENRDAEVRVASTFNNNWGSIYENIRNGKLILAKCADDAEGTDAGDAGARGIGEILLAYNLAVATDVFGDTPYTQVGDIVAFPYPEADSQESIYKEVFNLLDAGIKDVTSGGNTVGQYDLIYNGNTQRWVELANGLKARYTLRLLNRSGSKDADYAKILQYIDASFKSAATQASMPYDGSNQNPMFDFEWSRDGISSCTSMYGKLMERNDPRAERAYWGSGSWAHYSAADVVEDLAPTGEPEECQYVYAYDVFAFSELAPVHYLSYHELLFIKAEVLVRLGRTDEAKDVLKQAVEAAFANFEVNVDGALNSPSVNAYGGIEPLESDPLTAEDADAYFDSEVAPLFDADPFKETMLQKYIGLWGANGETVETYADIRRLKAEGKDVYGLLNTGKFPLRCPYGQDDVVANPNIAKIYTDAGNYVFSENVWWAGGSR